MIQEVTVLSGKGGTGKTSLVGSFAVLAKNKVMVDCDVDAADLHLILKPEIKETNDFYGLNEYQRLQIPFNQPHFQNYNLRNYNQILRDIRQSKLFLGESIHILVLELLEKSKYKQSSQHNRYNLI